MSLCSIDWNGNNNWLKSKLKSIMKTAFKFLDFSQLVNLLFRPFWKKSKTQLVVVIGSVLIVCERLNQRIASITLSSSGIRLSMMPCAIWTTPCAWFSCSPGCQRARQFTPKWLKTVDAFQWNGWIIVFTRNHSGTGDFNALEIWIHSRTWNIGACSQFEGWNWSNNARIM